MTTETLIQQYVETGIIQFGRFQRDDGRFQPVSFNFLLLPSYTETLRQTAKALLPLLHQCGADRILTTRAAIPLGAVLAAESDIPMTYPYGEAQSYTNAYVIEGAYDVGHPTALLTYVLDNDDLAIIEAATKVGLVVKDILCIFALGNIQPHGVTVHALVDFGASLNILENSGVLTTSMREHVGAWLENL
jgi:hypothetical protein